MRKNGKINVQETYGKMSQGKIGCNREVTVRLDQLPKHDTHKCYLCLKMNFLF